MKKSIATMGIMALMLGTSLTIPSAEAAGDHRATHSDRDLRDWDADNRYWRETYPTRSYYDYRVEYDTYEPAYRYGAAAAAENRGKRYEDLDEADLRAGWERFKDKSELAWERAKDAVRDSYNRVAERLDDNDERADNR